MLLLTQDEKDHQTPNGYFIIDKRNALIHTGLTKEQLREKDIHLSVMEKIL